MHELKVYRWRAASSRSIQPICQGFSKLSLGRKCILELFGFSDLKLLNSKLSRWSGAASILFIGVLFLIGQHFICPHLFTSEECKMHHYLSFLALQECRISITSAATALKSQWSLAVKNSHLKKLWRATGRTTKILL